MGATEKNDNIILKGTHFKEKPLFSALADPKFDDLVRCLMLKYGETLSDSRPPKGKEEVYSGDSKPVPIPLQQYFQPYYEFVLLVVGSDESDTLVLSSPIADSVRSLLGYSKWSRKTESYKRLLEDIESNSKYIPLTYDCTRTKLERDWHKTIHLRGRDTVQLYVVPKPLEYFPMLFINCSTDNVRNLYGNITNLMIYRNEPEYYCPYLFTCAIFRPILFNILGNCIEYRRRLPGIDATDEEYVQRRTEWLFNQCRYMVSDCRCRSNTAVLPPQELNNEFSWSELEPYFYNFYCNSMKKVSTSLHIRTF